MDLRKSISFLSPRNNNQNNVTNDADIVKQGFLLKRKNKKNQKNRYFVLRQKTDDSPARLECYDSEKQFLNGGQPKKNYILKDCFNISQKPDEKYFVIALYIGGKDCIGLVTKTEEELKEWLNVLQEHRNQNLQNANSRIEYEHVWPVTVLQRSLASSRNLTGQHYLCLTNWVLSLVNVSNPSIKTEFPLSTIKRCGFYDQFFFVTLGRASCIGYGELYTQTEDSYIAQNIHDKVSSAMNFRKSSSGSEGSVRPRTMSDTQSDFSGFAAARRERSDSVPNSRRSHPGGINIQQQHLDSIDSRQSGSRMDGESKTGKASQEFDEEFPTYLRMKPFKGELFSPTINSPRGPIGDFQTLPEDSYISMDHVVGERHTPNTLGISPRVIPVSHSPNTGDTTPQGGGISLWRSTSIGVQLSSPQSSGSHSRNASHIEDAYIHMVSPGAQGQSGASSPYLEMGPGPSVTVGSIEKRGTVSTPTPSPIPSPSDDDFSNEMFGNSGSSSCTSGTPSDQHIHDIGAEDRGDTPHSGMWNNLSPNYMVMEDLDCLGGPRPIRTNSVGSKPEQFKRKNRLDAAIPAAEPARVRAFSVGSRVSLKFGVGRHGAGGTHQGIEHPTGGLGEIFPSIKECGKQAKSKSSSAPMLGASPVSHSWSGTPGSYFRGFIPNRNALRETNLMELDFSKNKSCDFILAEDKDKDPERKSSKERMWYTFTGHRQRSNSKSSGGSNSKVGNDSWGAKEKRKSESECSSRGVEIPRFAGDRNDYHELDFTPSPRSTNSDPMKGYLPMHPPTFLSSSLTTTTDLTSDRSGTRISSLNNENYHDMSSSLSSCASQDGYVDMTRGGSSGALTIASSSSSSNSINAPPAGGRPRRSSGMYAPVVASQELPSPMEDLVMDEELEVWMGEGKKKSKKGSKRKSFREGSKRKKSEGSNAGSDSPEFPQKTKSHGPLATLTSLISRRPNNNGNPKTPLSPKGSPLPPKGGKESSSSPFSSLTRTKSKEKDAARDVGEDRETISLSEDLYASSPPSLSPQHSYRRRTLGGLETASLPPFIVSRGDEKMLLSPLEGRLLRQTSHTEADVDAKRNSAYVNMEEVSSNSLPSLNLIQKGITKPLTYIETRNYVNMQPGSSSPQLSSPSPDNSSPKPNFKNASLPVAAKSPPEENYMMMGGLEDIKESRIPSLPSAVAKRPEIPPTLLSSHSHPPPLAFEKLSLKEEKPVGAGSERSRSHSGPGAPEGVKGTKKTEDGRAASACSSPISYSPPTSPTLGSVSSMSSLSEGGLSSASSTCTVVNVGLKNSAVGIAHGAPKPTPPQPYPSAEPSIPSLDAKDGPSCSSSVTTITEDETLNYVALDLGSANNNNNRSSKTSLSPRLTPKCGSSKQNPSGEDATNTLSYVEIDFKKSEGLRNTSLARDSKRPH